MLAIRLSACLFVLMISSVAYAIEPGNYAGDATYGGNLTLSVKKNNVFIEVTKPGCQGDTQGPLKKVRDGHWRLFPDMPGCVIDFRQRGQSIAIKEGENCFQIHGAMCSFDGTVTGKGIKQASQDVPKTSDKPDQTVMMTGTWSYGHDAELGLSAYIRTDAGAVGLSCLSDRSNPARTVALRATNDLIGPSGVVYMFAGKTDAGMVDRSEAAAYGEVRDTTCGVALDSFRTANVLHLFDGKLASVSNVDNKLEITISQSDKDVVVSDGTDAAQKLIGISIPLTGSAKAIEALLRVCPAARLDVETNCGI